MRVLVDSDALIALAKSDDSNHAKIITRIKKLKKADFFTSPFTIPEVCTMLSYRVAHVVARDFLKRIRERLITEMQLDYNAKDYADKIFLSANKNRTSWFDCYNIAVYKLHDFDLILSFDKFYKDFGLRIS